MIPNLLFLTLEKKALFPEKYKEFMKYFIKIKYKTQLSLKKVL